MKNLCICTPNSRLIQFKNCSLLRDGNIVREDLWVRDGKIVDPEKVFFDEQVSADGQIDCNGALISPGFLDLQINGGFGVDFSCNTDDVEKGIGVVARGILAHGVTAFCPTIVTSPSSVYHSILPILKKTPGGKNGAAVLGLHLEGPFINPAKKGAHPENLISSLPEFHHRDPGLVGLLASDVVPAMGNIYYGLISDGVHTHPSALRIAFRTNPKGLVLVTDAIAALGLRAGTHQLGQASIEIRNSRAYIAGTETLCGSVASMIECVRIFHQSSGCSVVEALEAATLHPAQVLGIEGTKGTLSYGADADFLLLGENLELWSTWIAGDCVYQAEGRPQIKILKVPENLNQSTEKCS